MEVRGKPLQCNGIPGNPWKSAEVRSPGKVRGSPWKIRGANFCFFFFWAEQNFGYFGQFGVILSVLGVFVCFLGVLGSFVSFWVFESF